MKRLRKAACCCLILPAFVLGGALFRAGHLLRPVSSNRRQITVIIRPNSDARRIARQLQDKELIRSEPIFLWTAWRRGALLRMKPGRYRLSQSMSPRDIVERLKRGPDDERSVVIPEGFTSRQIAERLQADGVIKDKEPFLQLVRTGKQSINTQFPLPASGLEGYLYPDTYFFAPNSRPEKAAQAMLDTFTKQVYDKHRAEIERNPHTLNEIVTIASLIEREAEVPADRPKIAGVIENRLRKNMRLQIDASVLYALGHHKTRVLFKDLEVKSPYNTYLHKGLPPGPIASPGLASIEAALTPEKHDFLYYVASADGSHIFTRTEAEHNAVVARLRAGTRR